MGSLEALLLSNSPICSGEIREWRSSSIFPQWRLEQPLRKAEDHLVTFSFKDRILAVEMFKPRSSL